MCETVSTYAIVTKANGFSVYASVINSGWYHINLVGEPVGMPIDEHRAFKGWKKIACINHWPETADRMKRIAVPILGDLTVEFNPSMTVSLLDSILDSVIGPDRSDTRHVEIRKSRLIAHDVSSSEYEDMCDSLAELVSSDAITGIEWVTGVMQ